MISAHKLSHSTTGLLEFERFDSIAKNVTHQIKIGGLSLHSQIQTLSSDQHELKSIWWKAYLQGVQAHPVVPQVPKRRLLRTVDLFSGSGGLANGVRQFANEMGFDVQTELIVDQDVEATQVYAANHPTKRILNDSVSSLIDYSIRGKGKDAEFLYPPELVHPIAEEAIGVVDLIMAGPPCQGHSNLNNHTRRSDPRNRLYLTVPAIAIAVGAPICVIENVPAILHDSERVVETARRLFEKAGYSVSEEVFGAHDIGWPQTRRRHFLIAVHGATDMKFAETISLLQEETPRSVFWAIDDLENAISDDIMNSLPQLSEENQQRIAWLFENDEHDLDLSIRPKSHRGGTTYQSVYGRMYKDRPAPTITTGFMSPGRGRFVHPTQPRTLTPREAARIQGFPDSYAFVLDKMKPIGRSKLSKWIGDAVPMPLGYAAVVAAFASAGSTAIDKILGKD